MRFKALLFFLLLLGLWPSSASAAPPRFIVRDTEGLASLRQACATLGCKVVRTIDKNDLNQVFLVTVSPVMDPTVVLAALLDVPGVVNAEQDQPVALVAGLNQTGPLPLGLTDTSCVQYFGVSVQSGYANQPAAQIVRLAEAQNTFQVAGSGIVADIDTGVDPSHPVLQSVLLPGWDFTRNQRGGSEMTDLPPGVTQPSTCTYCPAARVNQSTAAVLDQSTAAVLDQNPQYSAFGHGTMVMGIIHLVAPQAMLLPLKAFHSDGTAFLSDILSAIYFAVQNEANVINMSFDLQANSPELSKALDFANHRNVICTASAGNDGAMVMVYPAALQKDVMGVASTDDRDHRSTFSNFGHAIVWVAAPGEGVISTFPFGTYGAAWGTSFSAPFVAGAASLLLNQQADIDQSKAAAAVAHAVSIGPGPDMGHGRLDLVRALAANSAREGDFNFAEAHHRRGEVRHGDGTAFTFRVVPSPDFTGTVNLSVTGLPLAASTEFDPPSITGPGYSVLTLQLDDDVQPGFYKLTVTGTSGPLQHSVVLELFVQPEQARPETLLHTAN